MARLNIDVTLITDPKTISLEEACRISGKFKQQLHNYCEGYKLRGKLYPDRIDYVKVEGVHGKRIVINQRWFTFISSLNREENEGN